MRQYAYRPGLNTRWIAPSTYESPMRCPSVERLKAEFTEASGDFMKRISA
jgi:hypothetical protein